MPMNLSDASLTDLVADQFKGKEKLITPNIYALELGYQYAQEHFECPMGMRLQSGRAVAKHISDFDQILMDGNTAAALGAVRGAGGGEGRPQLHAGDDRR